MKFKVRKRNGANLAEFAAVLTFGLPLLLLMVYVTLETAHFYIIKSAMESGARTAARGLVVQYNMTGTKKTTVDFLTIPAYIASSNQFNVAWDASSPPSYVSVTCAYPTNGGNGLQPFPAGPLRYLFGNATFDMKNIQVQGSFSLPVQ